MSGNYLVIVESPTKARTIKKFLPRDFQVEASMGHVRDLPQSAAQIPARYKKEEWASLGVNVDNDFEPLYVIPKGKKKIIDGLKRKLKTADALYLATDEDREGESISWHLIQLLNPRVPVHRMVFDEITKEAIQEALENTREIDLRLVRAQEARRLLDRLVGYSLSPLIWKKIAFGLSAGRVQSAGLRVIVERERERLAFRKASYWDLKAELEKDAKAFEARLLSVSGKRIATGKDFDETTGKLSENKDVVVLDEERARALADEVKTAEWKVTSVEHKTTNVRPGPPFITSTLQQEANRKLGLSARDAMRIAQSLYERGLITYMRTDSPNLSAEAIRGARGAVEKLYGKDYLSPKPRQYSAKSRMAQEAHEAIRPAGGVFRHPSEAGLSGKDRALYDLIWKRTVATQMAEAKRLSVSVRIDAAGHTFGANGMKIAFPGFLRAYVEGKASPEAALEEREVTLPDLVEGDVVQANTVEALAHETKPPARYTEASLVQRLDQEGIGRPSTYAMIIGTIQERGYVRKVGNALVPTFTGMAVVQLLERHFEQLVDYRFTSRMEEELDEIASGDRDWLPYLSDFFLGSKGLRARVQRKEKDIDPESSRTVDLVPLDGLSIKIGRYGPYIVKENGGDEVRASIPEDIAPAEVTLEILQEVIEHAEEGPKSIGRHPETGEDIYCLLGRYGPYVQLGEVTDEVPKPKRASVPREINYRNVTIEQAVKLLSLPRELGPHPDTGEMIVANNGRFGPYVVHQSDFRSLKKDDNVYTVTLERALEIFAQPKRGRGGTQMVRQLGEHPDTGKRVDLYKGKYGVYIKYGSKNVGLPKETDHEKLTLEQAVELVNAKAGTKAKRKTKAKAKKTKTKRKAASKTKTKTKTKTKSKSRAKTKTAAG